MTDISDYADLVRRLLTFTHKDGPICDIACADAAEAIIKLSDRCFIAEQRAKFAEEEFEKILNDYTAPQGKPVCTLVVSTKIPPISRN